MENRTHTHPTHSSKQQHTRTAAQQHAQASTLLLSHAFAGAPVVFPLSANTARGPNCPTQYIMSSLDHISQQKNAPLSVQEEQHGSTLLTIVIMPSLPPQLAEMAPYRPPSIHKWVRLRQKGEWCS